eukprot:UN11809
MVPGKTDLRRCVILGCVGCACIMLVLYIIFFVVAGIDTLIFLEEPDDIQNAHTADYNEYIGYYDEYIEKQHSITHIGIMMVGSMLCVSNVCIGGICWTVGYFTS